MASSWAIERSWSLVGCSVGYRCRGPWTVEGTKAMEAALQDFGGRQSAHMSLFVACCRDSCRDGCRDGCCDGCRDGVADVNCSPFDLP
jgi:hypothetical protein